MKDWKSNLIFLTFPVVFVTAFINDSDRVTELGYLALLAGIIFVSKNDYSAKLIESLCERLKK